MIELAKDNSRKPVWFRKKNETWFFLQLFKFVLRLLKTWFLCVFTLCLCVCVFKCKLLVKEKYDIAPLKIQGNHQWKWNAIHVRLILINLKNVVRCLCNLVVISLLQCSHWNLYSLLPLPSSSDHRRSVANEVHGCGKARPVSTLSVSELNYLYQQHCEQVQAHMKAGHDFCCSEFDDEFESLTVKEQQLLYEHAFKQQLQQQKSSNTPTSTHPPPSSSASSSKSSKLASSADLYDYVFHHDPANCPDCCQQFNDQTRAGSKAASTSSSSSTSGPACSANDLIDENDSLPKCAKEFNECKHFLKKNISKRLHLQQIPGYINSLKRESLVHSRLEQKLKEKYNNSTNNNSSSSQQANSASKVQSSSSAMNGNNIPLPKTLGSCEQGCCCAGVSRMRTPIPNIKPIPTVVDVKVSMGTGAGNNNQKNVKKTSRTNSNDSSESTASSNIRYRSDNMDPNNVCTLMNDCKCKACLKRQKLTEELIAEEESNKKKKQKKKKKKAGKQKNQSDSEVIKEEGEEETVVAASDSVDNVKSTEEGDTDFDQAKTQIVINNSKLGCFIEDKVSETPSKSSGKSSNKSSKSTNNNSGEQNGNNAAQDEWIQVKNTKSFKFGDESTPGTPGTNKRDRTSSSSESKERLQESDTLMASLDDTLVGPICSNSKVPVNGFTVSELNLNSYRGKLWEWKFWFVFKLFCFPFSKPNCTQWTPNWRICKGIQRMHFNSYRFRFNLTGRIVLITS